MTYSPRLTEYEIRALPVTFPLHPTASDALGISRSTAYRARRDGTLPFPVIRAGTRLLVTRAALLAALGIDDEPSPSRDER